MYISICKTIQLYVATASFWISVAVALLVASCIDSAFIAKMADSIINVAGVLFAGALAAVSITLGYLGLPSFSEKLDRHKDEKKEVYVHFCTALRGDVIIMLFSLAVVIFLLVFEKVDIPYVRYPFEMFSKARLFFGFEMILLWMQISALKDIVMSIFSIVELHYEISKRQA